jgi:pilus assembly protein CpaB
MKFAVIGLIGLGVLAAICAAVLMTALTSRTETAPAVAKAEEAVDVLLAVRDMSPMTVVDTKSIASKKVPKSQVPEGALLNPVQVVGKVLTDRMVANQPFTKFCFAREGKGVYLAAAVPPGKRAMSITLSDWSGMAGLLYPGSVVDVLVSFKNLGNDRRDENEAKSTTLLQGLMVLAIGAQSVADDQYQDKNPGALAQTGQINFRMVTLLVDPKQAEVLQLAMQSGSISLALRNPQDASQEARRVTRAREIAPGGFGDAVTSVATDPFSNDPKLPPTEPDKNLGAGSPNAWETLIIRGRESEMRTFPLSDDADAPPHESSSAKPLPQDTGAAAHD